MTEWTAEIEDEDGTTWTVTLVGDSKPSDEDFFAALGQFPSGSEEPQETPDAPSQSELDDLRQLMEQEPQEELVVTPEESAAVLAEGTEMPRWPKQEDPDAPARARALREEREAAAKEMRPGEFFEFQYPEWRRDMPLGTPGKIQEAARAIPRAIDYASRERERDLQRGVHGRDFSAQEQRLSPVVPFQPSDHPSRAYDPSSDIALAYWRGDAVPPKGYAPRDASIAIAKGEVKPPDLRDDFTGWAGTLASRALWTSEAFLGGLSDATANFAESAARVHSWELHRKAKAAAAKGERTFTVSTPRIGKGESGVQEATYNVEDFILSDKELRRDEARMQFRENAVLDELESQRAWMDKLLEDDPDLMSLYTATLWRQNVADMLNGLAQFVVYGSGAFPMSHEEYEARGFLDNFMAAQEASEAFGGKVAAGLVASYAKSITDPVDTFQTEGPTMILDALAFGKALKASALASKIPVPDEIVRAVDGIETAAKPFMERIRAGRGGRAYDLVRQYAGEHSQQNLNKNAEKLGRDIIMESETKRRVVDNIVQSVVVPAVKAGSARLKPRQDPKFTVRSVQVGVGPDGAPIIRDIGVMADEVDLFNDEFTRLFREGMEESGHSKRVEMSEPVSARIPSGVSDGEFRYAKKPRTFTLDTPEQVAAWDEVLEVALAEFKKLSKKKGASKKIRALMGQLTKDLSNIAHKRGSLRPMAPEVVEAAKRAEAVQGAAKEVARRRSPWGMYGSQQTPIETRVWTTPVKIRARDGDAPQVTPGRTLSPGEEQAMLKSRAERLAEGENIVDMSAEMARKERSYPFSGPELAGMPADYRITPRMEFSPSVRKSISDLADHVTGGGDEAVRFINDLEANVARSIDDSLPEIMRSKKFRELSAERLATIIMRRFKGVVPKGKRGMLIDSIERMLDEVQAPLRPESGKPGASVPTNVEFEVYGLDGEKMGSINLLGEIAKDVMASPQGGRILTESVAQTARRAGFRRAQKNAQGSFIKSRDESAQPRWTKYNERGYPRPSAVTEAMRSIWTYLSTGSMPAVYRKTDRDLATDLAVLKQGGKLGDIADLDFILDAMRKEGIAGLTKSELLRKLDDMERWFERYVDFSDERYKAARGFLRVDDELVAAERGMKDELGVSIPDSKRQVSISARPLTKSDEGGYTGSVYVDKRMADSLNNYAKAHNAYNEADFFMHLNVFLKSNLTARRLSTLKNNVLSNVFLQVLRRGELYHFGKLISTGADYYKWRRNPGSVSSQKARTFEALARTGKIETSFVDEELKSLNTAGLVDRAFRMGWISGDQAKVLKKLDAGEGLQENLYKASEEVSKVEEGMYGFQKIEEDLRRIGVGRQMALEIDAGNRITLKKVAPGKFQVGTGRGRKFKAKKTIEEGSALDDIMAKAAMRSSDKLFFDYFDVADMARKLRVGKAFALVSPFYTWLSKAMDIPFLKKGLVSELFSNGPWYWTDDAGVQARRAVDASRVSATAHMAANAAPGMYDREDAQYLREMFGWGGGMQVSALGNMTDGVLQSMGMNQANPFSATDLVFRALEGGASGLWDAFETLTGQTPWGDFADQEEFLEEWGKDPKGVLNDGLDELPKKEADEVRQRRKWLAKKMTGGVGLTLADTLDLIGLAGSPLIEIWHLAAEGEKRGQDVRWDAFARRAMGMVLGGTRASMLDAAVGGIDPTSSLTTRYKFADPLAGEEEAYIRGAIRKITGVGFRGKNFDKLTDKHFIAMKKRWRNSLIQPINEKIRAFSKVIGDKNSSGERKEEYREMKSNAERIKRQIDGIINEEIDRAKSLRDSMRERWE